jgi:preprotein translocase subunit SecY
MGLLNMFSGGAFANASIMALGIMPYISASIFIQLLGIAVPYFQRMMREGESGRRKINQITRYLTVLILLFQAPGYIANLHMQLPESAFITSGWLFTVSSTIILTAGSMFVMWLGERITDKGIGNGISLIIMVGIISRLPFALLAELVSRLEEGGGFLMLLIEIVVLFFIFEGAILLVQGTRRVPVQYAKRIVGNKQYGGVQAIMFIPMVFAGYVQSESATGFAAVFSNYTGFWYNFVFALLIILFTYFYTAITINPTQMADDMKRNGGFIPGVKPGKKTVEFLDSVMSKITLPGSIFLALVAILPAFAQMAGVDPNFAQFYGGTSLLILVGVVLDTLQQIESHLLMRHYDGLLKSGRIKGRSGGGSATY